MTNLKQVIIARSDLSISRGKLASQVAHASVEAVLCSESEIVIGWRSEGMPKIVLQIGDQEKLRELIQRARHASLISVLIEDDGLTEFGDKTITCGAIGPDEANKINKITGGLKLLI
ncbi:MAG: aminoacyl-tRNA hydrolase [Candidatus Paceibacterota bacterium]